MLVDKILRKRMLPFYYSYAVGLIIPIILGTVLYVQTNKLAERDIDTRLQFTLERAAIDLAAIFGEAEFIVTQASSNDMIMELAGTEFFTEQERQQRLNELLFNPAFVRTTSFSRFISDFYLILPKTGVVLSNRGTMTFDSFYRYVFALGDVTAGEFLSLFVEKDYEFVFRNERAMLGAGTAEQNALLLLHSLSWTGAPYNLLLFVLDRRAIQAQLDAVTFDEGSATYVADHRGTLIGSVLKESPRFSADSQPGTMYGNRGNWRIGGKYREYAIRSPDGTIRLEAAISRDVIENRVAYIRLSTLIVVLLMLTLDIGVVAFFSTGNARPLSHILKVLQNEGFDINQKSDDRGGSLNFVEHQITGILHSKHFLEGELNNQRPILNSLVLQSLIHGIRIRDDEFKLLLSRSGVNLDASFHCCFILDINSTSDLMAQDIYQDFIIKKLLLEELLAGKTTGTSHFLYQNHERIVVIHSGEGSSLKKYHNRLVGEVRKVLPSLREKNQLPIIAGVGNPYTSLIGVKDSFEEASVAVGQYAPLSHGGIAVYGEYVDTSTGCHYPLELELKLMTAVRQGSDSTIRNILTDIKRINFHERNLTLEAIQMLFEEIRGTIVKLIDSMETVTGCRPDVNVPSLLNHQGQMNQETFMEQAESSLLTLGTAFRGHNGVSRSALSDRAIEEYLEESFRDINLSLMSIADDFGVSEKYFSRYFKDHFHINFHSYVEQMRLNHIREKLLNTDLPLNDLICNSGYASPVTFSRAFKRAFGANPSVYRGIARESPD